MSILRPSGLYILKSKSPKKLSTLRNKFTIRNTFPVTVETKLYAENDKYICIPRFGGIKNVPYTNKIKPGTPIEYKWTGSYRPNQLIIAKHLRKKYLDGGRGGAILKLEAGQGKSYVAMGLIRKLRRKTLIVVHNTTMLTQWIGWLSSNFPNNTIGQYWGKRKQDGDIVVGVINSLVVENFKIGDDDGIPYKRFFAAFGFVIWDECHKYMSARAIKLFKRAQTHYMLGLSATPDPRLDKKHQIPRWFIGPVVDAETLPGFVPDTTTFTGNVNMIEYIGHPDYIKPERMNIGGKEMNSFTNFLELITQDKYRLQLIVDQIIEVFKNKTKNMFVFADRIDYLKKIQKQLAKIGIGVLMLTLTGGAKQRQLDDAKKNCRIILSTYSYMGTGLSIPRMDSLLLATPRRNKLAQFIGRIFRLDGQTDIEREIIDIVDAATPFKYQSSTRKIAYKARGLVIKKQKISYKEVIIDNEP